jgi:hypothetical protein
LQPQSAFLACSWGGGAAWAGIVTESLNFNDNLMPSGWNYYYTTSPGRNVSIRNGQLEVGQVDSTGGIYRPFDSTGVSQVKVEYDGSISNVYWGMGTHTQLRNNLTSDAAGFGISNVWKGGYGANTLNFALAYATPTVAPVVVAPVETRPLTIGDYHITTVFQDGQMSLTVANKVTPTQSIFSTGMVSAPGFLLSAMHDLVVSGFTTTGASAKIDNVVVTTTTVPLSCNAAQVLQNGVCTSPAAPTLHQLTKVSEGAYHLATDTPNPVTHDLELSGFKRIPVNSLNSGSGFVGAAYYNSSTNQTIFGFGGTDISQAGDRLADASFLGTGSTPTSAMRGQVSDAVGFVNDVFLFCQNANNGCKDAIKGDLTTTGHSLGGALAQLVGAKIGVTAQTFNAPGSMQLAEALTNELNALNTVKQTRITAGLENDAPDTTINYRLYGDLVSTVGRQFGREITVDSPLKSVSDSNPLFAFKAAHLLEFLALQLDTNAGEKACSKSSLGSYPNECGPTVFSVGVDTVKGFLIENYVVAQIVPKPIRLVVNGLQFLVSGYVTVANALAVDPGGKSTYTLIGNDGSPRMKKLTLPTVALQDVKFNVSYLDDSNNWVFLGLFNETDEANFGNQGVMGWRIDALDAHSLMQLNSMEDFLFLLNFTSDGQFVAQFTVSDGIPQFSNVAEPNGVALVVLAFMCALIVIRRKAGGYRT